MPRDKHPYNIIVARGQSLSDAVGGQPIMTTTSLSGVYQGGQGVRYNVATTNVRAPVGSAALFPFLVPSGSSEGYIVSAVNGFRRLSVATQGQPITDSTTQRLLGQQTGTDGQTITALCYSATFTAPATQNYFAGEMNVFQSEHDLVVAAGSTPSFVAVVHDQGQADYASGGLLSASAFEAATSQYIDDSNTYITTGIFSQAIPPLWVLHQTGGSWTIDNAGNHLGIGMGQIGLAIARKDVVLSQPGGNVPSHVGDSKAGHPTTNGHRWLGCKDAQVLYEVLVLGRNWDYMRPLSIYWRNKTILISVNPKVGPLQFNLPFAGFTQVASGAYPNQGFQVIDSIGTVPIDSVALLGNGTIILALDRAPSAAPTVECGGASAAGGHTFVTDSDPWVAPLNYLYTAASGQDPTENISAFVNKPYPMQNSIFAFSQLARAI